MILTSLKTYLDVRLQMRNAILYALLNDPLGDISCELETMAYYTTYGP